MIKRIYKYTRVSTEEQNEARQVEGLKNYEGELHIDKISGKIAFEDRPEGKKIIEAVKNGIVSELIVFDVDRLGRDVINILETLKLFKESKVCVTIHKLSLKSFLDGKPNPIFELLTTVMATVAQMELDKIKERQKEGIKAAKERGVYVGKPKGSKNKDSVSLVKKHVDIAICIKNGMSINDTVKTTGKSKSTVKRVRNEYFATKDN